MSDKYDKLEKLNKLRDQGIVTEEEFQLEKNNLLSDGDERKPIPHRPKPYWGLEENVFCMRRTPEPIGQFRSSFFRRNSSHRDVGHRKREFRQSRRPWKDRFQLVDIQHDLFHLLLSSRSSGNRDSHAYSLRDCQRNLHNPRRDQSE
tara:strand:- start:467 stop:907 length:441 start_codon:yes stop_codon:yes gene_type:complete